MMRIRILVCMALGSLIVPWSASLAGASTSSRASIARTSAATTFATTSATTAATLPKMAIPTTLRGIRCETRNAPREVSRRNYVIDRVTECRPLSENPVPLSTGMRGAADCPMKTPAVVLPEVEAAVLAPIGAEAARAFWSPDRKRLANVQFGRTLSAMPKGIRRLRP